MKKNLNVLIGFPVGISVLMISYVLLYVIVGEELYLSELSKLVDPEVLINQLLWSGVLYVLYFMVYKTLIKNIEDGTKPCKFVFTIFGIVAVTAIISIFVDKFGRFGEDISALLVGIGILLLMGIAIVYSIINAINIEKINKALDKRNCLKKD